LKKIIPHLLVASLLFSACQKEKNYIITAVQLKAEACLPQTDNPAGRTYLSENVIAATDTKKTCGIIPLSSKNYWVYQDSIFANGDFVSVKMDTLRYAKAWQTTTDNLIWWEGNLDVGIPRILYVNDSALFTIENQLLNPTVKQARKDYALFTGDSSNYISGFDDLGAFVRAIRVQSPLLTEGAKYSESIYFEKKSPNYRRDQVYFKTGIGVLKYITELVPMGERYFKLQRISTLVSFHVE